MTLELRDFPLEYVTGVMRLPPFGDTTRFVMPVVSVVNVGGTAAHTRTVVYRARQNVGFDRVFDSATDHGIEGTPVPDLVNAGTWWSWAMDEWPGEAGHGNFWFSIRATSPNLVPSIEFEEADSSGVFLKTMDLRYVPGDFAVIQRRVRVLPPVVEPGGVLALE